MKRRGAILVAVLILVTLAGMVAAGMLFRMRSAVAAAAAVNNGEQAYAAAMSGIQRAITVLETSREDIESWYDNPDLFRNQPVYDDGTDGWYFTVYAPNPTDETIVRYGLIDEAAKINLNAAIGKNQRDTLLQLPNMTDELVDCLMDYGDGDQDVRPQGAEQDYYDRLDYAYLIKNGVIATLDELLLVKGFYGSIVFGEDYNLNGVLDVNEDDGNESFPPDDSDGHLDMGLRSVLTMITVGRDVDSDGQQRTNINGNPSGLGRTGLRNQTIEFIKLYRAENNTFAHPADLLNMWYRLKQDHQSAYNGPLAWSGPGPRPQVSEGTIPAGFRIASGVRGGDLGIVCDKLTARQGGVVGGLINVNTAPVEVLAALPGIDESAARSIVSVRGGLESETKTNIAWLYTQGALDEDAFKAVAPMFEARSYQYRIQVIGFGVPCGRFRVVEAVIDLFRGSARIAYLRDITRLGLPCDLDVDLQETAQ